MSTGTELIEDALRGAGVISVAVPSEPEQIDTGLKRLQSLMQLWLSKGIILNTVPIKTAGADLEEPIDARNAIVDNLAISMAHYYRLPVSIDLAANARVGLNDVRTLYQEVTIPDKIVSSSLPKGAGNNKGIDAQIFFRPDETVGN